MLHTTAEHPTPPLSIALRLPPETEGGIWSNFAVVKHSPYEFTLDFIRLDLVGENPVRGVLVQRVNMSPQFVAQLIGALEANLSNYAAQVSAAGLPDDPRGDTHG